MSAVRSRERAESPANRGERAELRAEVTGMLRSRMVAAVFAAALAAPLGAQAPKGVVPMYEGFLTNPDGSHELLFGYFNQSWEEEVDVPVEAGNLVEPGGSDQEQPTHFFPRRNRFVFKVHVPADFGKKEVVWTLTTKGETAKAYATL